jgi:hypothetical protein
LQQAVIKWRWLFISCLALVITLSLMPINGAGWFPGQDKLMHALTFAALFLIGSQAVPRSKFGWTLFLGLLAYGVLIELLQETTGYRSMEAWDVAADLSGLVIGSVIAVCFYTKKELIDA